MTTKQIQKKVENFQGQLNHLARVIGIVIEDLHDMKPEEKVLYYNSLLIQHLIDVFPYNLHLAREIKKQLEFLQYKLDCMEGPEHHPQEWLKK